jgi:hypothetical protein
MKCIQNVVSLEVIMAGVMKVTVFWDVTLHGTIVSDGLVASIFMVEKSVLYPEDAGSRCLQNVGNHLKYYLLFCMSM